jgi:FtsP/CotA-like multicopper oxidase with cupredoxin domain
MARADVMPMPVKDSEDDPKPGTVLMKVLVDGGPATRDGQPSEMPFPRRLPDPPLFLANITDQEWKDSGRGERSLEFNSGAPDTAHQHTIEKIQFGHADAHVSLELGAVEEWTIKNATNPKVTSAPIDHPFHIHINPFQITEVFDPNENLTDPVSGQLLGVLTKETKNGKQVEVTRPIPKYVMKGEEKTHDRQCVLDPADEGTWHPCEENKSTHNVWWDVFAIPSGRHAKAADIVIPGYFKMRSRFVDFPGQYVLHCHILIHEDRGMMFTVSVSEPRRSHNH